VHAEQWTTHFGLVTLPVPMYWKLHDRQQKVMRRVELCPPPRASTWECPC
jgi:hypothetical protein